MTKCDFVKCEFVNRDGFVKRKVLEEPLPYYYTFAKLPPLDTESWFGDGEHGPTLKVDQLLFRLKRQVDGYALYEEF